MSARKKARPAAADLHSTSDDPRADAPSHVREPVREPVRDDASEEFSARVSDRMGDSGPQAAEDRPAEGAASRGDSVGGDSVGGDGVGSRFTQQGAEPGGRSHQLLQTLFHELFQTEQSAALHPEREARRLGTVPPADALRQVAEHARRVLVELPEIASRRRLPVSRIGQLVGLMFSNARSWFTDHLLQPERSYRGTLLGMRHGVDLVALIRDSALVDGDAELAEWCARWLLEREPLVEAVAAQLQWFAETPEAALGNTAWEQAEQLLTRLGSLLRERMAAATTNTPRPQARPADTTVN